MIQTQQAICIFLFTLLGISSWVKAQNVTEVAPLQVQLTYTGNGCKGGNTIIITSPNGQPDRLSYVLMNENGDEFGEAEQSDTISGLDPGKYYLKVYEERFFVVVFSNVFEPIRSKLDSITIPSAYSFSYAINSPASCNPSQSGIVQINISGGVSPYILTWSDTLSYAPVMATQSVFQKNGGTYLLQLTDNAGCSVDSEVVVPLNNGFSTLIKSEAATCGMSDGYVHTISSGGAPHYTFSWSNGNIQPSLFNVGAGTYSVNITDQNNCVVHAYTEVLSYKRRPVMSLVPVQASCNNNGIVTVSVSGPSSGYSLTWHTNPVQNSMTGTGLPNRWYPVTVTDQFGCSTRNTVPIPAIINPAVQPLTNTTCGALNGSGMATPSNGTSPYSIVWSNGATTMTVSGLSSGIYTGYITDAAGCKAHQAFYVQLSTVNPNVSITTNAVEDCRNGVASLNCSNCTGYQYQWEHYPSGINTQYNQLRPYETAFITLTDPNGCESQIRDINTSNPLSVTGNFTSLPSSCNLANGSSQLSFSFPNSGNYSVDWYDGQNTQGTSLQSSAINLPAGNQSVKISNTQNCEIFLPFTINSSQGLQTNINQRAPVCNLPTGFINISASGGTAPYQYVWNLTPMHTDSVAHSLLSGSYTIQITDAAGCTQNAFVILPDSGICHGFVRGTLFTDYNGNGVQETGETGLAGRMVSSQIMNTAAVTDSSGNYTLMLSPGNHTLQTAGLPGFSFTTPQTILLNSVTAGQQYAGNNFGLKPISNFQDLEIQTSHLMQPRHIQPYRTYLSVKNKGNMVSNAQLVLQLPAQTIYTSTSQPQGNYSGTTHALSWTLPVLPPYAMWSGYAEVNVPTSIPMASMISCSATLDPVPSDSIPADNFDTDTGIVSAPYDPNDIMLLSEYTYGKTSNIQVKDSIFTYRIRFQNTGNDTAFNIIVLDTLDTALQLETFELIMSSAPVQVSFDSGRVARFYFPMIMLPDSTTDPVGSQGMVVFRIHSNPVLNYTVKSTAHIYFDFNAPVATNTSAYTWVQDISNQKLQNQTEIRIYPNPASTEWVIESQKPDFELVYWILTDIHGREIFSDKNVLIPTDGIKLPAENLTSGMYILNLNFSGAIHQYKLVKN